VEVIDTGAPIAPAGDARVPPSESRRKMAGGILKAAAPRRGGASRNVRWKPVLVANEDRILVTQAPEEDDDGTRKRKNPCSVLASLVTDMVRRRAAARHAAAAAIVAAAAVRRVRAPCAGCAHLTGAPPAPRLPAHPAQRIWLLTYELVMIPIRFAFPLLVLTPIAVIVLDLAVDVMELLLNEVIIVRASLPVLVHGSQSRAVEDSDATMHVAAYSQPRAALDILTILVLHIGRVVYFIYGSTGLWVYGQIVRSVRVLDLMSHVQVLNSDLSANVTFLAIFKVRRSGGRKACERACARAGVALEGDGVRAWRVREARGRARSGVSARVASCGAPGASRLACGCVWTRASREEGSRKRFRPSRVSRTRARAQSVRSPARAPQAAGTTRVAASWPYS
jgi:hypothetical protein